MQWPKRSINFIPCPACLGSLWGGITVWKAGRGVRGKLANCLCAWPFVSLSSWGLEMFYNKFEERILGSSLLAVARPATAPVAVVKGHPKRAAAYQLLTTVSTLPLSLSLPLSVPTPHASIATHSFIFIVKRRQITVRFLNFLAPALPDPIMLRQAAHAQALSRSRSLWLAVSLRLHLMLLTALLARFRSHARFVALLRLGQCFSYCMLASGFGHVRLLARLRVRCVRVDAHFVGVC